MACAYLAGAIPRIIPDFEASIEASAEIQLGDSGSCGENITWELDNEGTLTISGSGDMKFDFGVSSFSLNVNVKKAVISDGITRIGENAFAHCTSLESVTFPDSVASIGDRAFYNTPFLEKLKTKWLHLEGRPRIVFGLKEKSRNTLSVTIPDVLKYGRIPNAAKYELENYFCYIIKKYGL